MPENVNTRFKNLPLFSPSEMFSPCDPYEYEKKARENGYKIIAGVDEAGRGPLAGPVVAAAVILPSDAVLRGVTDSKKLSAGAREAAFELINQKALAVGLGVVSQKCIDKINILRATLEAMRRAVLALSLKPDFILVDGNQPVPFTFPQKCVIRGDQKSMSISAASVMAKVYRDRIMMSFEEDFPEYDFVHNKGYGTAGHIKALKTYGPSPVHRLSFKGVK